ncbi:UNVERIFIED_ORG: hypothetical protein J2X80_001950 [Pseudomonas fluorescens]|nr:hypothetical protein [Pseudomonas fluorescens]
MKNVVGVKPGAWGETPSFGQMRVWPLTGRNIWNINIYKKNIYKKQIDNQHQLSITDRNTPEHTGTTFQSLFQKCSAIGVCRNNPQSLVQQGIQRFFRKSCSAMFRVTVPPQIRAESPENRGFAISNF